MMKPQILIIYDDPAIRQSIQTALQSSGRTDVSYVSPTADALNLFAKGDYCLVIMDIR